MEVIIMTEQKTRKQEQNTNTQDSDLIDGDAIDQGFIKMETLYRSRCVQPPNGSNVTIREIKKDD